MGGVKTDPALFRGAVVRILIRIRIDAVAFVAAVACHFRLGVSVGESHEETLRKFLSRAHLQAFIEGVSSRVKEAYTGERTQDAIIQNEWKRAPRLDGIGRSAGNKWPWIVFLHGLIDVH